MLSAHPEPMVRGLVLRRARCIITMLVSVTSMFMSRGTRSLEVPPSISYVKSLTFGSLHETGFDGANHVGTGAGGCYDRR
jgi:hypothetical protein